jgi:type I restriction enzyme R subunit
LLAVSSIDNVMQYYDLFKEERSGEHDLRIATIPMAVMKIQTKQMIAFRWWTREWLGGRTKSLINQVTADKLKAILAIITPCMERVLRPRIVNRFKIFQSISRRLKKEGRSFNNEKDRLDIVIVVNMMHRFWCQESKYLYVDKNLKQHGLIQAFSRTESNIGWAEVTREHLSFRKKKQQMRLLCFRIKRQ